MNVDETLTPESNQQRKKIPGSIIAIGTFQVAASLWMIFLMAVTGEWQLGQLGLAIAYGVLGAGLLAVMEWARFIGVVTHTLLLPIILWRAVVGGEAGLIPALQIIIVVAICTVLSRPHIRAKFRRTPYPTTTL